MVGIVGMTDSTGTLQPMVESVDSEPWYERSTVADNGTGLGLVHHGSKDPNGKTTWRGEHGKGVVYGTVSNRRALGLSTDELFEGLLERPETVLQKLSGPFLLACTDTRDGSVLVATDKLGSRSCYYADTDGGLVFSSELKGVLTQLDDARLDEQAAGDLLTFGYVLGDKTLVEGVSALQPATMLEYQDGECSVTRYWEPEFGRLPADGYAERSFEMYRESMAEISGTLDGDVGLWLSGGLDSRTMAAVLREEYGSFQTLTYDGNPSDGTNIEPARRVADHLGVDNEIIDTKPGEFGDLVRKGVDVTDGMISWSFFVNPDFIFNDLHETVDVIMEGAPQGELFGEEIWLDQLTRSSSPTEAIARSFGETDRETVKSLLNAPVDPIDSIRAEVAKSDQRRQEHRTIDTWFRNFCSNAHFRSNKLARSQVGMRIPFTNGEFLDHLAKMPHEACRRSSFPLTRGKIPRSMSPLKLRISRRTNSGLEKIPYERTGLAPTRPMWLHDASYVAKQARWRLFDEKPEPWADWYRTDPKMRSFVNRIVDDACSRDLFDEAEIRRLQREHLEDGKNNVRPIAALTTLEVWLQRYLD